MADHDELESAIRYGLTQAKPGTAARILALEVERLRVVEASAREDLLKAEKILQEILDTVTP